MAKLATGESHKSAVKTELTTVTGSVNIPAGCFDDYGGLPNGAHTWTFGTRDRIPPTIIQTSPAPQEVSSSTTHLCQLIRG